MHDLGNVVGRAVALAEKLVAHDDVEATLDALAASWDTHPEGLDVVMSREAALDARMLLEDLRAAAAREPALLATIPAGLARELVVTWAESAASRPGVALQPLFASLRASGERSERLGSAVRARVARGPLGDALGALACSGGGAWLREPASAQVLARIELLVWEAGAGTLRAPELGRWLWQHPSAFDALLLEKATGTLRDRVFAARLVLVSHAGFPSSARDEERLETTARLLEQLASHPEPLVWVPAARALGQLASHRSVRRTLDAWRDSSNLGKQRRIVTALASMPAVPSPQLVEWLRGYLRDPDPWVLAAVSSSLPELALERRTLFSELVDRLAPGCRRPEPLWAATQGAMVLLRDGHSPDPEIARLLAHARRTAMEVGTDSATDAMLWSDIRRWTAFLDGLPPAAGDPEGALDRLVRPTIEHGAHATRDETDRLAISLRATFVDALDELETAGDDTARKGALLCTVESSARALALALWQPLLAASGPSVPAEVAASATVARRRAARLVAIERDTSRARNELRLRAGGLLSRRESHFPTHRMAVRVLGSALDATPDPARDDSSEPRGRVAGSVLAALDSAPWLHRPSRRDRVAFQQPVGYLLWRIRDAVRSPARDADEERLPHRLAAWWAIASRSGAELLSFLERGVGASVDDAALKAVEDLQVWFDPDIWSGAISGDWKADLENRLEALGASRTALATVLVDLAGALAAMHAASARMSAGELTESLRALATVVPALREIVANPALALSPPQEAIWVDPEHDALLDESLRIRGDESLGVPSIAARWVQGVGPVLGPLVLRAVGSLLDAHRGIAPTARPRPTRIGQFVLDEELARGGMGEVWRVHQESTDLPFVMKLPASAFDHVPAAQRAELLAVFEREVEALKAVRSRSIVQLVHYDVRHDPPYLVFERLRGVNLESYLLARTLSIAETKPIVEQLGWALEALHSARSPLVHCDLKPANVFLCLDRLPEGYETLDRVLLRDARQHPIRHVVLIDFGIARRLARAGVPHAEGFSGTLGFVSAEQAREAPVGPATDVYGLAATLYAALTGHTFFPDEMTVLTSTSNWMPLRAKHVGVAPLDDAPTRAALGDEKIGPPSVRGQVEVLLHDATHLDPELRIPLRHFVREWLAL